ncbi:MAG: hypothetical protein RIA64_01920 [Rhodospirillales bacterium]
MERIKSIAMLVISLSISGCSSIGEQVADIVFMPHSRSAEVKGEEVGIDLHYVEQASVNYYGKKLSVCAEPKKDQEQRALSALLGTASTALVGAALDQVEKSIEAEGKRFIQGYSKSITVNNFCVKAAGVGNTPKKVGGMTVYNRLAAIRFYRIVGKDSSKGLKGRTAMSYCLRIDPVAGSDGKLFQVAPIALDFHYSKAKVVAFDLLSPFGVDVLNPWEVVTNLFKDDGVRLINDDDVDLTLSLKVDNLRLNTKNNTIETTNLAKLEFPTYKKLKMRSAEDERTSDKTDAITKVKCGSQSELIAAYNASTPAGPTADATRYFAAPDRIGNVSIVTITVNATEVDDFGERVKQLGEKFKSEKAGFQERLSNTFSGSP